MNLGDAGRIGFSNVRKHKLRSVLTTLGIILGVGAVIATVALGASFESAFVEQFRGVFTPEAFTVSLGSVRTTPGAAGFFTPLTPVFTEHDVVEVSKIPSVKSVFPLGVVQLSQAEGLRFKDKVIVAVFSIGARATNSSALGKEGFLNIEAGRSFNSSSELVVGHDIAKVIASELNSNETHAAIGAEVSVRFANGSSSSFTVIGVLKESPFAAATSPNVLIYMDLGSHYVKNRQVPGSGEETTVYESIVVISRSVNEVKVAQDDVRTYLKERSDAKKFLERDSPNLDFLLISQQEVVSFIQTQLSQFESFIGSIGSISLLVGSIGIANTMMVSVTERTREIGVMKATGARKKDILQLFLLEASVISAIGAIIGVAVGVTLAYFFTVSGFFADLHLPLTFRFEWFPIAVAIGVGVGVGSGLYPAWRAARVNPVEALRYE